MVWLHSKFHRKCFLACYQTETESLLFLGLSSSRVPETLGEGVVVDLELGDLLILVGRDGDEFCLLENVGPECRVGKLEDVVGSNQVESRLVFVHRVEDSLLGKTGSERH